jgi:hypothetical protein
MEQVLCLQQKLKKTGWGRRIAGSRVIADIAVIGKTNFTGE